MQCLLLALSLQSSLIFFLPVTVKFLCTPFVEDTCPVQIPTLAVLATWERVRDRE